MAGRKKPTAVANARVGGYRGEVYKQDVDRGIDPYTFQEYKQGKNESDTDYMKRQRVRVNRARKERGAPSLKKQKGMKG